MHCLMSSEEWHRKIPFTGYLLAISISVPVVDLESVRRVASGAQNIVFLAGWELLEYLGRGDMFMSQHLRYGFQRYALRERDRRGKCMPGHMDRRIERQPACLVTCRNDIFNVL